jgi:DNA-binding Lrp family transcriptional regulator
MKSSRDSVSNWKEEVSDQSRESDAKRFVIYRELKNNQPVNSYGEIAKATGIDKSTVSRIMKSLVDLGMAKKIDTEGDEVGTSSRAGKWVLSDYKPLEEKIFQAIKDLVNSDFATVSLLDDTPEVSHEHKEKILKAAARKVAKKDDDEEFMKAFNSAWEKFEEECEVQVIRGEPVVFEKMT